MTYVNLYELCKLYELCELYELFELYEHFYESLKNRMKSLEFV